MFLASCIYCIPQHRSLLIVGTLCPWRCNPKSLDVFLGPVKSGEGTTPLLTPFCNKRLELGPGTPRKKSLWFPAFFLGWPEWPIRDYLWNSFYLNCVLSELYRIVPPSRMQNTRCCFSGVLWGTACIEETCGNSPAFGGFVCWRETAPSVWDPWKSSTT